MRHFWIRKPKADVPKAGIIGEDFVIKPKAEKKSHVKIKGRPVTKAVFRAFNVLVVLFSVISAVYVKLHH